MVNWRIAVLWVLGLLPWAAVSAQQKTILRVSATVEEYCDVAAGDYTAQRSASLRATLRLRATCTPNTTYHIGLNKGTSHSTDRLTGVGTGEAQDHTVDHTLFGGVPATHVVPPGGNADALTLRVYY